LTFQFLPYAKGARQNTGMIASRLLLKTVHQIDSGKRKLSDHNALIGSAGY